MADSFEVQRQQMVQGQLVKRGITDQRVLAAIATVPRELFVPAESASQAYQDGPLPIGEGQTISQPYIVAFMLEALQLRGDETVLEVGTGSGYAAAVLSKVCDRVVSIERKSELADRAIRALRTANVTNVTVRVGDGTLGFPEAAPFDAIVVAAGGPELPESLTRQLADGGRIVMPVGPQGNQQLIRYTKDGTEPGKTEQLVAVRFVPLIGDQGWDA